MLDALNQDLRLAYRSLWQAKTFTGTAALTLALGIAGTTVMFALIHGVLLRPLPVRDQDRLVIAWKELRSSGSARYPFGNTEIEAVSEASQLLEKAAGVTRNGVGRTAMIDDGVSAYANVAEVTGGFFDVLGVQPVLGRALSPADEKEGAESVIVLSERFWQGRYGASREVIGHRVTLDDQSVRIVGVMPADLDYPTSVEVWRPTSSVPTNGPFGDAVRREVNLIARLRPGVTIEQATSEIVAFSERLEADAPANAIRGLVPVVRAFAQVVVGDVRTPMLALFGAVGLILLIATANVANLLLMRAETRRGELALRAALGAARSRILSQVLIESLVVAGLGGVAGVAITWWSLQALISLVPDGLPRAESVRIDSAVVWFSIGVVLVSAFLAGLAPALLSMRVDLVSQLRTATNGITSSTGSRGRRMLVVVQVALAVTVVAAAGLLIKSVLRLQSVELGLPADRLVLLDLHIPEARYADRRQHARFLDDVIARLEAVPAIAAATPVNVPPFSGQGWDLPRVTAEGQNAEQAAANPSLNLESIHPNYFETLQVPIVRGRAFTTSDREGAMDVAIVSGDVAERAWPGGDPIGKRLKMGELGSSDPWYIVVGVAGQTRYRELRSPRPTLYLPAAQFQMTATMLVLRTTASLELVASLARDQVHAVDRDVQVMRVAPFAEMLNRPLARPRFNAFLLSIFGIVALLLSTVGLYAVMAAYVRQREREIAIRLAIGATATRVRQFVLAETVRLAGLGALLGVAGAVGANPLVRGMLFDVDPLDAPTMIEAALLLVAAAALASYLPVRRATRVDAMAMLRGQ
jgi:putative ABC transport system permease protein